MSSDEWDLAVADRRTTLLCRDAPPRPPFSRLLDPRTAPIHISRRSIGEAAREGVAPSAALPRVPN